MRIDTERNRADITRLSNELKSLRQQKSLVVDKLGKENQTSIKVAPTELGDDNFALSDDNGEDNIDSEVVAVDAPSHQATTTACPRHRRMSSSESMAVGGVFGAISFSKALATFGRKSSKSV